MGLLFKSRTATQWRDAIRAVGHGDVHNFSFGTLDAYFNLSDVEPSCVDWDGNLLTIRQRGKTKTWAFYSTPADIPRLEQLRLEGPIYAKRPLSLPKGTKFHELAYNLKTVFDPASYANSQKRKRIKRPLNRLIKNGYIVPNWKKDFLEIMQLHRHWVTWKMADPATFQMMFPKRRYLTCVEKAFHSQDYIVFTARNAQGRVDACRVFYFEGDQAFGLAQFGRYDQCYHGFAEDFATATMRGLLDAGITRLNCGASLNKKLSAFKMQWPHEEVVSFMYGRG